MSCFSFPIPSQALGKWALKLLIILLNFLYIYFERFSYVGGGSKVHTLISVVNMLVGVFGVRM